MMDNIVKAAAAQIHPHGSLWHAKDVQDTLLLSVAIVGKRLHAKRPPMEEDSMSDGDEDQGDTGNGVLPSGIGGRKRKGDGKGDPTRDRDSQRAIKRSKERRGARDVERPPPRARVLSLRQLSVKADTTRGGDNKGIKKRNKKGKGKTGGEHAAKCAKELSILASIKEAEGFVGGPSQGVVGAKAGTSRDACSPQVENAQGNHECRTPNEVKTPPDMLRELQRRLAGGGIGRYAITPRRADAKAATTSAPISPAVLPGLKKTASKPQDRRPAAEMNLLSSSLTVCSTRFS
jgi:hypothetical protein